MELAQLPPDEAEMFMGEYGIEELGLQRVIRLSYDLLGLQSFFTVGEDEVRAWTIRRAARRQWKPPARSIPTCRKVLSAPKWCATMT